MDLEPKSSEVTDPEEGVGGGRDTWAKVTDCVKSSSISSGDGSKLCRISIGSGGGVRPCEKSLGQADLEGTNERLSMGEERADEFVEGGESEGEPLLLLLLLQLLFNSSSPITR